MIGGLEDAPRLASHDDFPVPVPDPPADTPAAAASVGDAAALSPAALRFQSCRWRRPAENGSPECCLHRDVLPMAGARGFNADSWCSECPHYKARRAPRKPPPASHDPYYYY